MMYLYIMNIKKYIIYNIIIYISIRELNLMVKYVTFNHCNMSSSLIALMIKIYLCVKKTLNKGISSIGGATVLHTEG